MKVVTVMDKENVDELRSKGGYYISAGYKDSVPMKNRILMNLYNYYNQPIFCGVVGEPARFDVTDVSDKMAVQMEIPRLCLEFQDYWAFDKAVKSAKDNVISSGLLSRALLFDSSVGAAGTTIQCTTESVLDEWVEFIMPVTSSFIKRHICGGMSCILQDVRTYA